MQYNMSNFLIETQVPDNEIIISRTNLEGIITYTNDTFAQISGYKADELIGKPHNIVRHPDMPKSVFKELWAQIQTNQKWSGVVKNIRKDCGYYWVFAQISGVFKDGKLVEYKSLRTPINFDTKMKYQAIYDEMKKKNGEPSRVVEYI